MEGLMVLRIILILAIAWFGAVLWMWLRQEHYLFIPSHYDPLAEFERFRRDRTVNGVHLQGWFLDKGKDKTVFYMGGNAEDLTGHCDVFYESFDANVLMYNYRGYGQSEGKPGEKALVADAIALYDLFLEESGTPPENIFLMGRSIGTGVAVQLAAARPAAGVILVTPYESIEKIARYQYPWLPIKGMLRHTFHSINFVPQIQTPALVILADYDEVIPVESGQRLGEAWGGPKEIIGLPTGHNDIHDHPLYYETINRFINGN